MQYHITEHVQGRQWEHDQQAVLDDIRRRAQHDLAAQNPGSTVTIDTIDHTIRTGQRGAADAADGATYLVDFVVEYTVSGQPNTFAA